MPSSVSSGVTTDRAERMQQSEPIHVMGIGHLPGSREADGFSNNRGARRSDTRLVVLGVRGCILSRSQRQSQVESEVQAKSDPTRRSRPRTFASGERRPVMPSSVSNWGPELSDQASPPTTPVKGRPVPERISLLRRITNSNQRNSDPPPPGVSRFSRALARGNPANASATEVDGNGHCLSSQGSR